MSLFKKHGQPPKAKSPPRARLDVEALESRLVPYSVSGNAWVHPELTTISFVPDGTLMAAGTGGNGYSNLAATFDAKWATPTWKAELLTAAQLWAQYANINFAVVDDNGATAGQGDFQQGDPGMGDIRIGGYQFSNNYLAGAYLPPPANNYSIAGDITFNTQQNFKIGQTYDLQTVGIHEFGHALGLYHGNSNTSMYFSYTTMKRSLSADDIAGIQAIYGARTPDAFEGLLGNNSFLTANPVTALVDPNLLTGVVGNLDITSTADKDYYLAVAPLGTNGTFTVTIQSSGLSLLRPAVTVYGLNQAVLGSASSNATHFTGDTISVTVNGVSPGQVFYVKVGGSDSTAFGTGAYGMTLKFGNNAVLPIAPPNTQTLNGTILQGGSGQGESTAETVDFMTVPGVPDADAQDHVVNDRTKQRHQAQTTLTISASQTINTQQVWALLSAAQTSLPPAQWHALASWVRTFGVGDGQSLPQVNSGQAGTGSSRFVTPSWISTVSAAKTQLGGWLQVQDSLFANLDQDRNWF